MIKFIEEFTAVLYSRLVGDSSTTATHCVDPECAAVESIVPLWLWSEDYPTVAASLVSTTVRDLRRLEIRLALRKKFRLAATVRDAVENITALL